MGDVVSLFALAPQQERRLVAEMAAACFRGVPGFLCTTGSRTAGLILPLRTLTRSFHTSRRVLRESQTKPQPGDQVYEGAEYIPQRKAKNPMKPIAIAWAIGFPSGIILFLLTKKEVDKNRLKQLKARKKMKASNEGEYERSRYKLGALGTEELSETKV